MVIMGLRLHFFLASGFSLSCYIAREHDLPFLFQDIFTDESKYFISEIFSEGKEVFQADLCKLINGN